MDREHLWGKVGLKSCRSFRHALWLAAPAGLPVGIHLDIRLRIFFSLKVAGWNIHPTGTELEQDTHDDNPFEEAHAVALLTLTRQSPENEHVRTHEGRKVGRFEAGSMLATCGPICR